MVFTIFIYFLIVMKNCPTIPFDHFWTLQLIDRARYIVTGEFIENYPVNPPVTLPLVSISVEVTRWRIIVPIFTISAQANSKAVHHAVFDVFDAFFREA